MFGMSIPSIPLKRRRLSSSLTLFNMSSSHQKSFHYGAMTLLQLFLEGVLENRYLRTDAAVDEFLRVQDRDEFETIKASYDNEEKKSCTSQQMWTSTSSSTCPDGPDRVVEVKPRVIEALRKCRFSRSTSCCDAETSQGSTENESETRSGIR